MSPINPCNYCKCNFSSVKERINHKCPLKINKKAQYCFICEVIVQGGNMGKHNKTKKHLNQLNDVDKERTGLQDRFYDTLQTFNSQQPSGSLEINTQQKIKTFIRRKLWGIQIDDKRNYDVKLNQGRQQKQEILQRRKNLKFQHQFRQKAIKRIRAAQKIWKQKNSKKLIKKIRK